MAAAELRRTMPGLLPLLLLAGGTARAAPEGCDLDVRFDRASLTLGARARAQVLVAAPVAPALEVTAGELGPPRELAPGLYEAELRPPREPYPQLAIVSAVAGARCGFAVLPLVGRAEAVASGAPGAEVAVRVGAATFGPVRADARGRARIAVSVPPGTTVAYHGDRPLALPPAPAVPHVQLAIPSAPRPADREDLVPVRALAVAPDGAPRPGAHLEVRISAGAVDAPVEVGPGVYAWTWRLPAGSPGDATIDVALAGEPPRASARVVRVAGGASALALAVNPAVAVAGGGPVEVTFTIRDRAGNPVDAPLEARASLGALSPPERVGAGLYRTALALPTERGGRTVATVEARAGEAAARLDVALAAAPAAAVRLDAPPGPVVADGRRVAPVVVAVVDRFGNVLADAAPRLDADDGSLSAGERGDDGRWTFRYRPDRRLEPGESTLRAAAATARVEARVALAPPRPWIWLAPRAGFAASSAGTGAAAGLSAEAWGRFAGEALGASVDVTRARLSRTSATDLGGAAVRLASTLDLTAVVAGIGWYRPLAARAALWLGAGAGVSFLSASTALAGQPTDSASGAAARAELSLAGGYRVPAGFLFVEARGGIDAPRHLATFAGALTTLALSVGYRWDAR
jgi:hypothetical protein